MSQSYLDSQIESVAGQLPGAAEDFRQLISSMAAQITALTPGGTWPTSGMAKANSAAVPVGISLSVSAANGVFTLSIKNGGGASNRSTTIYYEVSYSTVKGFTAGVVTESPTAGTSMTLSLPGATYFFRVRATYDLTNWSSYSVASNTAASSGLISSAATSEGGAFNQTNFMTVDSVAVGSEANVRIYGTGGPRTNGVSVKGATQRLQPSATVINVQPASSHFVGWDGASYVLKPTLADVLADDLTPIGKVDVVGTGTPTLPTVVPILSSGGIIAYNVTNGGTGATAPYIFTISDTPGSGATTGAQTFTAGVLTSLAPGNPGQNYDGATTVTASGGTSTGATGGGTALGGNGGRLTAV